MPTSAFEDPALVAKAPQPFAPITSAPAVIPAAAAPAVVAPAPAAVPAQTSPAAAAALFPHLTDGPAATAPSGLAPKLVKTQAIHPDASSMNSDLAAASNLGKGELATAKTTAGSVIDESGAAGVTNLNQVAYELATARRESHMGNWMNEFGGNSYFEQHYGSNTKKGAELGNTQPHDGANFHGRGLVQTTGRTNYTNWTEKLGKEGFQHDGQAPDLVNHPDLAAQPDVAARIAVEGMRDAGFTKYKLGDFVNDKQTDYLHARRVINGMDAAPEIAAQATKFQGVLQNHSGDYTDAMIKAQTKNLPSAHDGSQLTAGSLTDSMMDPTRMTAGAAQFAPANKLLTNSLGHFGAAPAATGKVTNLKTHVVE